MKKYLFSITAFIAVSSLNAQAIVKVATDTDVRVQKSTLFYIGGNIDVEDHTNTNRNVFNEGNIRVTGNFTSGNNSDGSNFINAGASGGNYGQLIINGSGQVSGKIASQVKFNKANFNFQTIAIPYTGVTAGGIATQSFENTPTFLNTPANKTYYRNRYQNPIFVWNNDLYRLDNLGETVSMVPSNYYTLSTYAGTLKENFIPLYGLPSNHKIDVNVKGYVPSKSKDINDYGEYYGSYIVDFTKPAPTGWGEFATGSSVDNSKDQYGANIYYFGNPYTSNIDLSKGVGFSGNIIYQETSNNYNTKQDVAFSSSYSSISVSTPLGVGDVARYVRPFQTFAVKVSNLGKGSSHKFTFNDDMKTFDINSSANNVLYNRKAQGFTEKINQVGLDLYDANGNNTGNRAYVVASNIYEASQKGKGTEIYNISMSKDDTGVYTLQEQEDGTVDENLADSKTYINGVNADKYVGKPIHLVFQNGKGHYTLKARLNDDLLNNKNKFYFEDKTTGKVVEINKDFEYSFDVNGTDKDRFVLYWAKKPQQINDKELANETTVNTVVIFKKDTDHLIRFNKPSDNKAKVFVYNISGQLVVSATIDTGADYVIPVKGNASVYIVKVVESNGKVTTKKIIK